jgi:hypothetical protein
MKQNSSKNRTTPKIPEHLFTSSPLEASTVSSVKEMQHSPHAGTCEADLAELNEALRFITTAFVDLGFGMSAAQQATRVANENSSFNRLVEKFHRNAA